MATFSHFNHPSLVLGNIAQPEVVDLLNKISACEGKVDAAQDKLNATITFKRSMTMTSNELVQMGINVESLARKIKEIDTSIAEAANNYMRVKLDNEKNIAELRQLLADIGHVQMPESPINMEESRLKDEPLFSESIKLDSQYFSFSSNMEEDKLANIEKFIRSSTNNLGSSSNELSKSVCDHVNNQIQNHNVCGTLIITASCTHRAINVFAPLIIDPDKAVNCWNSIKSDKIDTSDLHSLLDIKAEQNTDDFISLITGAAYGSSFVGMVHILQSNTDSSANLDELKTKLDKKLRAGGWLADSTGDFGIDPDMLAEVKAFLSTNSISCHVSVLTMGAIPTIKSNELSVSVNKLVEMDGSALPEITVDTGAESVNSQAQIAKQRALIANLQNARIKSVLGAVSKTDDNKNSILDTKSLLEALNNYTTIINDKSVAKGVPISFFIKRLTKHDIVKLWINKYNSSPE